MIVLLACVVMLMGGSAQPASAQSAKPPTPSNFQAAVQTQRSVKLTWQNDSSGFLGYVLWRWAYGVDWTYMGTLAPDTTSFLDSTVLPGSTYWYYLAAYDAISYSDWVYTSASLSCLPPGSGGQGIPQLAPVLPSTVVPGGNLWLFAVDDGSPQVAVSAETGPGRIVMGRLDLRSPSTSVQWRVVATASDAGGQPIADHWHIFAHGYHWIVFASGGKNSYLLKLDKDFNRVGLFTVVENSRYPTNDMNVVEEPGGVAVAHFVPGWGEVLYRFNVQGQLVDTTYIGGGVFTHGNGSSALSLADGYLLLASETLNPAVTGAVKAMRFDSQWHGECMVGLVSDNGTNAAMPSGVRLASGHLLVNLRIRSGVAPRGTAAPGSGDDSGALIRLMVAPDGTIASRETLVSAGANRPHTSFVGDQLITTWDAMTPTGPETRIRIDRVILAP